MTLSNADYDSLMREYETTRDRHRREREEAVERAEARIPELRSLTDELRTASLQAARRKLADPEADTGWLREKTALITARKRQLLLAHGLAQDALDLHYDCPACKDTGYVGGRPCLCFRQKAAKKMSLGLGDETFAEDSGFSSFSFAWYSATIKDEFLGKTERWFAENAVRSAKNFVKNVGNTGNNLFLYGNVGVGKTHLLRCIARELLWKGCPVCYFDAGGLFDLLADAAFRRTPKAIRESERIERCEVLLIDDLGTEYTNAFVGAELFRLINERGNAGLSTAISSNLGPNDIGENYSERVVSRLLESYVIARMTGRDIRLQKKQRPPQFAE